MKKKHLFGEKLGISLNILSIIKHFSKCSKTIPYEIKPTVPDWFKYVNETVHRNLTI